MKLSEIKTFYINLDEDVEKRENMEHMLSSIGFTNYERFSGIKAEGGCRKSHYKLLSSGIKPPFIVLEDDCALNVEVTEMEAPDNIDMIYLGISSFGYYNGNISTVLYNEVTDDISRIYNMLSTHAMLYLSERYVSMIKHIAEYCSYKTSQPFDKSIAEIQKYFEVYALNNPFFYQDNYNKQYTCYNLKEYITTQNIIDNPIPQIVRPEPILFEI